MNNDKIKIDPNQKPQSGTNNVKVNKPNELGGINLSSHVKIFDPNSGELLVQKRGDV